MNKNDLFQALTLWFVVAIFLQTAPESIAGPLDPVIAIIAVSLVSLILPLYILIGIGTKAVRAVRAASLFS